MQQYANDNELQSKRNLASREGGSTHQKVFDYEHPIKPVQAGHPSQWARNECKPVVGFPMIAAGGAVVALEDGGKRNKQYTIQIKGSQFCPDYLQVEEGSFIEWVFLPTMGSESNSHVICFDELPIESDCL